MGFILGKGGAVLEQKLHFLKHKGGTDSIIFFHL